MQVGSLIIFELCLQFLYKLKAQKLLFKFCQILGIDKKSFAILSFLLWVINPMTFVVIT
jgi:hypothetical protein